MAETVEPEAMIGFTAEIVAAHVSNNHVPATDIPDLIRTVHGALAGLAAPAADAAAAPREPAVPVRASVKPDYIVCLEDGRKMKTLKRYLAARYGLSPDDYRRKWGLPADYPMVAPNYAEARRDLAKRIGLGTRPR